MVSNPERRTALADAGIRVLAREGARGLTHRALDNEAGVPRGTASNYFRTRGDIVAALMARLTERLTPDPVVARELAARPPGRELFADYLRDIVRRLTQDRDAAVCLFELRLEGIRRPEIAEVVARWQREAFAADVAFNAAAGLPGGRREIALFHYALDGLLLDRLTTPLDPDLDPGAAIDALVAGLL